jgi:hypothetical protein
MKDSTRKALQAYVTKIRQHLAATEQAIALDSLPDVLLGIADLMERVDQPREAVKRTAGDQWVREASPTRCYHRYGPAERRLRQTTSIAIWSANAFVSGIDELGERVLGFRARKATLMMQRASMRS